LHEIFSFGELDLRVGGLVKSSANPDRPFLELQRLTWPVWFHMREPKQKLLNPPFIFFAPEEAR